LLRSLITPFILRRKKSDLDILTEMLDELFEAGEASLLPGSTKEIKTSCSCPDIANPWKHIAAAFYIAGEASMRILFCSFKCAVQILKISLIL